MPPLLGPLGPASPSSWPEGPRGHIAGSPFSLSVINLRPDASKCEVRGDAPSRAVARQPAKFEVLYVDAMGHPSQAEELDVWVERFAGEPPPPPLAPPPPPQPLTDVGAAVAEGLKAAGEAVGKAAEAVGKAVADAAEDGVNAMEQMTGGTSTATAT